jgi:hypothetical protein
MAKAAAHVHLDIQRIAAQPFFGARRLRDDGHHHRPAFQSSSGAVHLMTLGSTHVEWIITGAHDAGDFNGHRLFANAGKWIVGAGVVVDYRRIYVGDIIGSIQPVLPHDEWCRWTLSAFT